MIESKCLVPFYVTATALEKLGDPEGEAVLTKAASRYDVTQMIPLPAALTRLSMRRSEMRSSGCSSTLIRIARLRRE